MQENEKELKFKEFKSQLIERVSKGYNNGFIIEYERPNDLTPLVMWMKETLDKLGIEKIKFTYINDQLTVENITYSIESSHRFIKGD